MPASWRGSGRRAFDCILVSIDPIDHTTRQRLRSILPRNEQVVCDSFVRDADRLRAIVGRATTRLLLGRAMGRDPGSVAIKRAAAGKPFVEDGPEFNVSHAGSMILFGLSASAPVGVDVEPRSAGVIWREVVSQLHIAEQTAIFTSADPSATFLNIWTRKEAVAKAEGHGLLLGLQTWSVLTPAAPGADWMVLDLPIEAGYVAAVASKIHQPPQYWRFKPNL